MTYDELIEAALKALADGDRETARVVAAKARDVRPDDAEALSVAGLTQGGEDGVSLLRQAVEKEPAEPRWHLHLGQGLSAVGQYESAQEAFARAAELSRGHPQAMTAWADCLMHLDRFGDAAQVYGRVLGSHQTPEIWMKAGDALTGAKDTISAAEAYERAYPPAERPVTLSEKLADINILLNRYDKAESFNADILRVQPDDPAAALRAANLKRWRGDHDAALVIQKEAIAKHPDHAGLLAALLDDRDDSIAGQAEALACDDKRSCGDRRAVSFALARHFDRASDNEKAWHYAQQANKLYDDGVLWDGGAEYRRWLTRSLDVYKTLPQAQLAENAARLIYVMGPPRCGGSLLQSVLAGADGVESVGERGALMSWLIPALDDPNRLAASVTQLAAADLSGMAGAVGPAPIYVDKTSPHIFVAGLLARIHPGAQFVVPHRNPDDMIVSMFFHDFTADFAYTRSVAGIRDYLALQSEAEQAWREAGLSLIDHDHDVFAAEPEARGEALFGQLGLGWTREALTPSGAVTRTFSARQVTQGVSKKFAGRGERYRTFLSGA